MEGKEPPVILDEGESVRLIFRATDLSVPFRTFVAEEGDKGRLLTVESLLVIQNLLRHSEIDTADTARIIQQTEDEAGELLHVMETDFGYLERGGKGRDVYWTLRQDLHRRLSAPRESEGKRNMDWETAKTQVVRILKQRAERGDPGLQNADIRQITHFDRQRVNRLIHELQDEGEVLLQGRGRGAYYLYKGRSD